MNTRTDTPTLRDQIAAVLAAKGRADATEIIRATGMKNTPSRVTNELNIMRTDGIIQCAMSDKNALQYWLSDGVDAPAVPVVTTPAPISRKPKKHSFRAGTRKAQVIKLLDSGAHLTASELCKRLNLKRGTLDTVIDELYKTNYINRAAQASGPYKYYRGAMPLPQPAVGGDTDSEGGEPDVSREEIPEAAGNAYLTPEMQYLAPEDYELPDPDPALLASANRMLGERLAGVAHVLRGSGLPALEDIDEGEDLQPHVAALAGAYQMARSELHACEEIIDRARALCASSGYNNFCLSNRVAGITDELSRLRHRLSAVDAELDATVEALAHVVSNGSDIDPADMDLGELVTEAGKQMNDLRQQLEALMRGRSYAANAAGYVMIASKRKPRRTMEASKAIAAAVSAVKGGAQRADVFALLPVGKAVKCAEWRPL